MAESHEGEEFVGNTDELLELMKQDEAEGATKLSPREYGRLRNITPQLVYHHIRAGHIKKENCICGRSVIDVAAADEFFESRKKSK
jgi:hypothetical protein